MDTLADTVRHLLTYALTKPTLPISVEPMVYATTQRLANTTVAVRTNATLATLARTQQTRATLRHAEMAELALAIRALALRLVHARPASRERTVRSTWIRA